MATEKKPKDGMGAEDGASESVDLDSILVRELGQFGRYQYRNMAMCALLVIFVGWANSEYLFTTARIPSRCYIPECDDAKLEYTPSWILNAVPGSADAVTACQRFAPLMRNSTAALEGSCPTTLFDNKTLVDCKSNVYKNTHSIVHDYDLGCEEWRRALIGTVRTLGTVSGLPITGYVSDRWGRRLALALSAFNTAWLGLARYFAGSYFAFALSEFAEAFFGSGGFISAYILMMELVGPKYRVAAGAVLNSCLSLGQISIGLLAWAVPNWRNLTLLLYLPQLLTISYYWLINESVRWLMTNGRFVEAKSILMKVADVNGAKLSEKSMLALQRSAEQKQRSDLKVEPEKQVWLPLQVWRHKRVLLSCCVTPFWWFTVTFVYNGLTINAVNISNNGYLIYVAVSLVAIPGYWSAVYMLSAVGRRPVLIGAYWTCAACQMVFIFLPAGYFGCSLAAYLVGKFAIAVVVTSLYVYTAELFPTQHRHSLFAFASMIGRVGSMVAPLTPALGETVWAKLPFLLFGSCALLSGGLLLLTPETRGRPLPDTLAEADQCPAPRRYRDTTQCTSSEAKHLNPKSPAE